MRHAQFVDISFFSQMALSSGKATKKNEIVAARVKRKSRLQMNVLNQYNGYEMFYPIYLYPITNLLQSTTTTWQQC
jgi:hypothetical protein